jgi:hypothetical protein
VTELHPFEGPRGLHGYTRFTDTYGATSELQESSALILGDVFSAVAIAPDSPGDYCWLRVYAAGWEPQPEGQAAAHLSRPQARELFMALAEFLDDDAASDVGGDT